MTYPPRPPDDDPRAQQFQPMSYDLAPEYGNQPPAPTSGPAAYPTSGAYGQPDPYGPPQSYPPSGYPQQPPTPSYPPSYPPAYPPGYQQPAPTYPGPVYNPAPPPPPKKGKGLKVTLGVVGGIFLVCAIVACVFFYPVISESGAHVSAPPTLPGDLAKEDSPEMQKIADQMESDLRSDVGNVNEVAAAIYSNGDPQKLVILVATTSTILFPDRELDNAFKGFNQAADNAASGSRNSYDAGRWGGTLKCAKGTSDSLPMVLCAWADHGSVGIGVFLGREEAESAALFKDIRNEVQSR